MTIKVKMTNIRPSADVPWYDKNETTTDLINGYIQSGDLISVNINYISDLVVETITEYKDQNSKDLIHSNTVWIKLISDMIEYYKANSISIDVEEEVY